MEDRPPIVALAAVLVVVAGMGVAVRLAASTPSQVELAAYATAMEGRSGAQRYNARLAAAALDGHVVRPGEVFSYNRVVRPWTIDQGYVKAPVSYDGELVAAYGGGVCQTSTTLYNAVLLAGLPVLERHAHVFVPRYATPGRDAAVAQYTIDLRFRNPHPWPIHIRAGISGERLEVRLIGRAPQTLRVEVVTRVLSSTAPVRLAQTVSRREPGRAYLRSPGARGYRVTTYRVFYRDGEEVRREHLSDDSYRPMNRVTLLAEGDGG